MHLQIASRKKARIKLGLQGPSGSGKTYSALLLAYGLAGDWTKVAVIDTENHSADLYSHLGPVNTLSIEPPFSPEKYIEAIRTCVTAGIEVVIIDSVSHEWEGSGGILDIHGSMTGNSFTNWAKITPRHNAFIQEILQSPAHVITTIRSKHDYVISERNGKQVPEKIGLKGVTREGLDYELTLVFDLDIKHNANASKDRTSLFMGKPECRLTPEIGATILNWCNSGIEISANDISIRIGETKSIQQLLSLYQTYPQYKETLRPEFEARKKQLIIGKENQLQNSNHHLNGKQ